MHTCTHTLIPDSFVHIQGYDNVSVYRLCVCLVKATRELRGWGEVCEVISSLCKKRGQLKRPIIEMVRLGSEWVNEALATGARADALSMMTVLVSLTEGKMFVEVERARLIARLAKLKEEEGDVKLAAEVLQDIYVETLIGMGTLEKLELILEQMKLVLACKDFVKCQIVSRRVNLKQLEDFPLQKLRYHNYLVEYHESERDFAAISKVFKACLETPALRQALEKDPQMSLQQFLNDLLLKPHTQPQTQNSDPESQASKPESQASKPEPAKPELGVETRKEDANEVGMNEEGTSPSSTLQVHPHVIPHKLRSAGNPSLLDLGNYYLSGRAIFNILSPHSSERLDQNLLILKNERKLLARSPELKTLIDAFVSKEMMPVPPPYRDALWTSHTFNQNTPIADTSADTSADTHMGDAVAIVEAGASSKENIASMLRVKAIQHNISNLSNYYSNASLPKLAQLLNISELDLETELCGLISQKIINAKINRARRTLVFRPSHDIVTAWTHAQADLLNAVHHSRNLLEKEKLYERTLKQR